MTPPIPRFSDDQARVLACVLDEIIPPSDDGKLRGAGEIDLIGYLEAALATMPGVRDMVVQSLRTLDALAVERTSRGFATLGREDRARVMSEHSMTADSFPPTLMILTYGGYYQHGRVLEGLGLEPRPPHPKGYEMQPDDLSLLDPVRRRPKLYRDC
jgi:hypothetical protein